MPKVLALALGLVGFSVLVGCGAGAASPGAPTATTAGHAHDPADHNHDRGHMMVASDGVVDALLTAHLSHTAGNELDIFLEEGGVPLAIATTRLEAAAVLGGVVKKVAFECAPPEERPPTEAAGQCSHFVARVPWLAAEARVSIGTELPGRPGESAYLWRGFEPAKYAHHVD